MKKMRNNILLAISLSFLSLSAVSADYYIDSSRGSDSATGTSPAEAWKTLARTRKGEIKPGDTVRLNNQFIMARDWTVRMENDWREGLTIQNNKIISKPDVPVIRWQTGMHEAFFDINEFKALGFN